MSKTQQHPDEYSVAVWALKPQEHIVMERCIGYHPEKMHDRKSAAEWALARAKKDGHIKAGDKVQVDVSEDASDEWTTELDVTV